MNTSASRSQGVRSAPRTSALTTDDETSTSRMIPAEAKLRRSVRLATAMEITVYQMVTTAAAPTMRASTSRVLRNEPGPTSAKL